MIGVIEIKMRDGIILRGVSYIQNPKKKCLTLLSCDPYRNFEKSKDVKDFGTFLSCIPANYLYMDIRGTGESDGCSKNEYSLDEKKDTNEMVQYIRRQPWSNSCVMMHGISYSAFNAIQATAMPNGPDSLFLMHVSNNRWRNDVHYVGGIKTIMEDMNYSFATTGQNLLPGYRCTDSHLRKNNKPWFMKWFKQGCEKNDAWKDGVMTLPPTFVICGWRDSYSSSAVLLSNAASYTLIGPFGHIYPNNHNILVKKWIHHVYNEKKYLNKIKNYKGPICMIIPTPRNLWHKGYYQVKSYQNPEYKTVFDSNERFILKPDLVGESLETYTTGDPALIPSLEIIRNDLTRSGCGYERAIIIHRCGVWGEPEIILTCLEYEKGDYIVARLTTQYGETLSVGVSRIHKGTLCFKLKPFFIPVDTYILYLFLNRSWVPVLFPTTNKKNITFDSAQLRLPTIDDNHYVKLNVYADKSEMSLLEDVYIRNIYKKDGELMYETSQSDGSFSEKVNVSCVLGEGTRVVVENKYYQENYKIKTITEINTIETDLYHVTIKAYDHNKLINVWKEDCAVP
jgi:hypothetical protein